MIKFGVFWVFLTLALSAAFAEKYVHVPKIDDHNVFRCETNGQDQWKILDSETVLLDGREDEFVEQTVTYPRTGLGKEVITCIRVTDLAGDGTGGFPYIARNGLGFNDVTIYFKSQRGHGLKFDVEIYGK